MNEEHKTEEQFINEWEALRQSIAALKESEIGQVQTEHEIIEARDFLENIFNPSKDGIMLSNRIGRIVKVNRAIEQMLGFSEDELQEKYTLELGPEDVEHLRIRDIMLGQLFETGYVGNWKTSLYRKNGSLCPVEIHINFLKDQEGNLYGAVAVIKQISGRDKTKDKD